ncbi:integrase catalytic domain-containing protein [Trichonephila clavipes]|nr:integrase catalytic domain-containing protein [Trichonephila clavipes]
MEVRSRSSKKKCVSEVGVENIGLRNVLSGEETVIEALEIEEISRATLSLPNPDAWAEMESKGFRVTFSCNESSENCEISLLIGSDFYWSLTHRIKRLDSSLVAVETSLGWSLQGKCDERSDCTSVHLVHSEEESISTELRRFWEIESLGILEKGSVTLDNGDEEILSEFDKSVNFVDGRYRVNLPWKPGMREALQNNKTVARKRFEGLVRRFKCDHELFCEYKDVIDDYVREGIVERTSCDSLLDSQGFYLPHHAVIRSDKTASHIRIVFDGSAHEDGQSSLNQTEILALKQNEQLRSSSEIKSLVPYLDENNLLRLTGRLLEADLCFGEKHPVILPRRCKFTELLVIREHERIGHCGVSATLTQLRKKYWISKGRQLVKTMIRICLVCKKYSAKPADQLSGQLPRDRITQSPPFQVVGIDFTGAILVKENQGTRKSYVSLFTCAVTRAVHLELVLDMSTKCFLLALRRFLARRGNCKVIYSDNARTFKAAERELAYFANILKDSEFQSFVADKGIHWKFIVERVPWWGGFYERLVKTIKNPLRKILGRALLTFEELSTILSEVEVIVNHRPLTYVENDSGEPEPLTPAHFLELGYGDSKYPIHFIELIDATTAKESYKKRKTYRTLLLKHNFGDAGKNSICSS